MKIRHGLMFLLVCGPLAAAPRTAVAQQDAVQQGQTQPRLIRSSELQEMQVRNRTGEKLGQVGELMIDSEGHIRYAALPYGGVLGLGQKLFAVPWRALKVNTSQQTDERYLLLDMDKETLEQAIGFERADWPFKADTEVFDNGRDQQGPTTTQSQEAGQ